MESSRSLYSKLCPLLKEISQLKSVVALLQWDTEVMMPSKAAAARAKQLGVLAGTIHEKLVSPVMDGLLHELEHRGSTCANSKLSSYLNPFELANVRLAIKQWKEARALTPEVVQASASLIARASGVWAQARKESNFAKFAPFLKEHIQLARQIAQLKIDGGVCEPARAINEQARTTRGLKAEDDCYKGYYQVLLDAFEPGLKDSQIHELFQDLKQSLVPLIAKIKAKNFQHDRTCLLGEWDLQKQAEFSLQLAKDVGFDLEAGRLDVSTHPFTGTGHPLDVRMTTRYSLTDIKEGFPSVIHEAGHSLYEQGRNMDYDDLPVNQVLSMGLHESQSLFWERMVGLTEPFFGYMLPRLKEQFPEHESLQTVSANQFYKAWNRVEPGFIRVDADEVTYSLHVILRYEVEKALVEGEITVDDVPLIWNAKMKEYLGLDVTEDRLGCLQDTHWATGLIGYFPTYTLGSIYAVQILDAVKKDIPDLDEQIARGDFSVLKGWLNENVHRRGSVDKSGDDLIFHLTQQHLDSSLYVKYLTEKYTRIYNL
ncbi:hypothetical protein BG004_001120 [Podila humilis]|nr:hypothetical protein BG004_001120 [Podila humilis]